MQRNEKFLVKFLHSFTDKQLFFALWAVMVGTFVMMLISFYRKQTRSNFRRPGDGPGPKIRVDVRKLEQPKTNMPVVVSKSEIKRKV